LVLSVVAGEPPPPKKKPVSTELSAKFIQFSSETSTTCLMDLLAVWQNRILLSLHRPDRLEAESHGNSSIGQMKSDLLKFLRCMDGYKK